MTIFKNKDGSFTLIYLYSIKTLVFQCKFVAYVEVSLQERRGRKKVRTAGLVHSVIKTCLKNIRKSHFIQVVLLICPMQEEKQTHIVKGLSICKTSTGI